MFNRYKPSGKVGVLAWPLLVAALVVAVVLGWLYQLLLHWIPLIYINVLLTGAAGMAAAFVAAFVVNVGKARSVPYALAIGSLMFAALLASKFWFQYQTLLSEATTQIIADENLPADDFDKERKKLAKDLSFADHIKRRVDTGFNIGRAGRGGNGVPISGIFVWLIWLIEAVALAYFPLTVPVKAAREPFSENLGEWASEEETVMVLPVSDTEMSETIRNASTIDQLLEIPIPSSDVANYWALYRVNSIAGEEMEDAYLSVDLRWISTNSKGESKEEVEPLVTHAVLTSAQRAQLVENAELLQEALAEYRKAKTEEALAEEEAESDHAEGDNGEGAEGFGDESRLS